MGKRTLKVRSAFGVLFLFVYASIRGDPPSFFLPSCMKDSEGFFSLSDLFSEEGFLLRSPSEKGGKTYRVGRIIPSFPGQNLLRKGKPSTMRNRTGAAFQGRENGRGAF